MINCEHFCSLCVTESCHFCLLILELLGEIYNLKIQVSLNLSKHKTKDAYENKSEYDHLFYRKEINKTLVQIKG